MDTIEVDHRLIGRNQPCFIIAEAGVNHNGNLMMALELVDAAVAAKADAVKFQTFKAEAVISTSAPKADYQLRTTGAVDSQLEMAKRLELSYDQFGEIKAYCNRRGILFLSTPFDHDSADFLDELAIARAAAVRHNDAERRGVLRANALQTNFDCHNLKF